MRARLVKMSSTMKFSGQGHDATSAGAEHAIEVELPWLQRVLGDFKLVPIDMGDQSYESSRALGVALAKLIKAEGKNGDTLVLASSDLSHYHPYAEAVTIDHKTLNALQAWDYYSMSQNFQTRVWEACGGAPIVAAMIYAERMGANQARVLKYANSGDVTGDKSRVVGYSADVFVKTHHEKAAETPFSLTDKEKAELLALARKSVEYAVEVNEPYAPDASARRNSEPGARRVYYAERSGATAGVHRVYVGEEASLYDGARYGYAGRAAGSTVSAGFSGGVAEAGVRNLSALAFAAGYRY